MRILRVAQKVYPDVKGGGPYHVHAMCRDQAKRGHDVTLLTVGEGPPREERDGYVVIRKSPLIKPLGNAIAPGIANYLQSVGSYDVVHAHSHLYFSTNLAALAQRVGETPLAITNHGLYSQTAPMNIFDIYLRTLGRWTFNQADVIFTYTPEERAELRELGVTSDIEVVPNGIDTERFTPEGPESDCISSDGPVVLFVGRFVNGKRPRRAVKAFAKVLDEYPEAEMHMCGDGPLREELESLVRELGIESAVTFLGYIPYDKMPAVYRCADVFLLPSRTEGVPRTVLEAMASGVPVVVSDLEQMSDIIGGSGRVVSPPEPEEFSQALCETLASHDTQTNGDSSLEGPLGDQYSWSNTVRSTTQALRKLTR
jgi:glycosyltransferase involved in cell wall biosynthesis